MTTYVNADVFCWIVNTLNKSITHDWDRPLKEVSLKQTNRHPYEVQVPIQIIGQFIKKNKTTINLYELQQLNTQFADKKL